MNNSLDQDIRNDESSKSCNQYNSASDRQYLVFTGNGRYEIGAWDLRQLQLTPHYELDNAWWIHYGGVRVGLLSNEVIGEADKFGYRIENHFFAQALSADISFTSWDSVQACIDLLVNGVL